MSDAALDRDTVAAIADALRTAPEELTWQVEWRTKTRLASDPWCRALTERGTRCSRPGHEMPGFPDNLCHQHQERFVGDVHVWARETRARDLDEILAWRFGDRVAQPLGDHLTSLLDSLLDQRLAERWGVSA